MPAFTFFWIFLMPYLLTVLCFIVCWRQHTKVSKLLVYKCLSCYTSSSIISLNFTFLYLIEVVSHDVSSFLSAQMNCLSMSSWKSFLLDFIYFKRDALDILMYVFLPYIILLVINIFFGFYVFIIELSIERINFYVIPIMGIIFIL